MKGSTLLAEGQLSMTDKQSVPHNQPPLPSDYQQHEMPQSLVSYSNFQKTQELGQEFGRTFKDHSLHANEDRVGRYAERASQDRGSHLFDPKAQQMSMLTSQENTQNIQIRNGEGS